MFSLPAYHVTYRRAALIAALENSRILGGLSDDDLACLMDASYIRTLRKNERLYQGDRQPDGLCIIQSGQVAIRLLGPNGRWQVLAVFHAGDSFGEATLVDMNIYSVNAVALAHSRVIVIRKRQLRDAVRRKPELGFRVLASVCTHLENLVKLLSASRGRRVDVRLAEWLVQQTTIGAKGASEVLTLPVTKTVLANHLGVPNETLSRAFARLRDQKIIRIAGSTISIIDRQKLRAYADGAESLREA